MPRLASERIYYKPKDFVKWLKGEMFEKSLSQANIAEWLNISQVAVSKKMHNYSFNYLDMLIIFKELGTDQETQIKVML